jgi:hypothetical protein
MGLTKRFVSQRSEELKGGNSREMGYGKLKLSCKVT